MPPHTAFAKAMAVEKSYGAQECDARNDAISTTVRPIKISLYNFIGSMIKKKFPHICSL